jgi:S1-C subfamily serine protease
MIRPVGGRRAWIASAASVVLLGLAAPGVAAKTTPATVLPSDRLVQLARPATVLVRTKIKGKVTTPGRITQAAVEQFVRSDSASLAAARRQDLKALFDAVLEGIARNPGSFTPGTDAEDVDFEGTGSGFVIADGVVMTNSHVVFGDSAGTSAAVFAEVVGTLDDAKAYLRLELGPNAKFTPAVLDKAAAALHDHLMKSSKAENITKVIDVERAARSGPTTFTASATKAGAVYPGDDLALLSVAELKRVPSLRFAAVEPRAGEDVFVLGFPGAATFGAGTDKASTLVPTLTKGVVSAAKTTEAGVPVLQVDASLAPGNSGGPVFSKAGEVVGVSVAGIESVGNFNFAIAGSKAATFASTPALAGKAKDEAMLLEHALRALESGWLRIADDDIDSLEKVFPNETVVDDLRSEVTRRRAAKEVDLSPDPPRSAALLGLSGLAALLLLAGGVGSAASWRRARKQPAEALDPVSG